MSTKGIDLSKVTLPDVPPPLSGYIRVWMVCKVCGQPQYYDTIPYSLSNPIMASYCGHQMKYDMHYLTEAEIEAIRNRPIIREPLHETIADIAFAAGVLAKEHWIQIDDSRDLMQTICQLAYAFEAKYGSFDWNTSELDYMDAVEKFAEAGLLAKYGYQGGNEEEELAIFGLFHKFWIAEASVQEIKEDAGYLESSVIKLLSGGKELHPAEVADFVSKHDPEKFFQGSIAAKWETYKMELEE